MPKQKIKVQELEIRIEKFAVGNYISLTDIAKKSDTEAKVLIISWLKNRNTQEFLETWERLHNPDFLKGHQMVTFRDTYLQNRNVLTPQKWIAETNAIGLISKSGRGGGTWAHSDIALNFCYWLSPAFQVFMIKEFQRLKAEEQLRLGDPFNIKRYLVSGNYSLLVTAILAQTDERLLTHPQPYKGRLPLASESDMLNKIVFGNTAKEWELQNTDKPANRNQRDYASILDLVILNNLEFLDAMLLQWDLEKDERQSILQEAYDFQYPVLKRSKTVAKIQELADSGKK
jgi:hypothetical protein